MKMDGTFSRRQPPTPTDAYPQIWHFAHARHDIYLKRVASVPYPWSSDPILNDFRFTNTYRAADRVSQYLVRMTHSDPSASKETLFLRTMLFKIFNRIDTWESIVGGLGMPIADSFDFEACAELLSQRLIRRHPIYSAAYIMPTGPKAVQKHRAHLKILKQILDEGLVQEILNAKSLADVYALLVNCPTFGPFLAYQYTVDLNYTPMIEFAESDFVVPGPGALDGLSKCFLTLGDYSPTEAIMWLTERQRAEFSRFDLEFEGLWGRDLQPIDVQNVLCEVSKYTRVSHPHILGRSGRRRIKQRFEATGPLPEPFFPPIWGLNARVQKWLRENSVREQAVAFALR